MDTAKLQHTGSPTGQQPQWHLLIVDVQDATGAAVPRAAISVVGATDSRFPVFHADGAGHFQARVMQGEYDVEVAPLGFRIWRRHVTLSGPASLSPELRPGECNECVTVLDSCVVKRNCPKPALSDHEEPVWSRHGALRIGIERVSPAGTQAELWVNVLVRSSDKNGALLTPCRREGGPTFGLRLPSGAGVEPNVQGQADWVCGVDLSVPVAAGSDRVYRVNVARAYALSKGRYVIRDLGGTAEGPRADAGLPLEVVLPNPAIDTELGLNPYAKTTVPTALDP